MILTEGSKAVCEYLVNSGSLYQNFFELEELKKTLSGDEVVYWLTLLHKLSLINATKFNTEFDWSELVVYTSDITLSDMYFGQHHISWYKHKHA